MNDFCQYSESYQKVNEVFTNSRQTRDKFVTKSRYLRFEANLMRVYPEFKPKGFRGE